MVAALAATLTARGVRVGILMGTAYLFTEEAVASAAIHEVFQRQVIAADRTFLLETAPGHATRCVVSPFTREFTRLRDEWRSAGVPDRQVWADLEALNVGRLRIASKAVARSEGTLVPVSEDEQLASGLFMAGQVALLRSARTTVAELHEAVTVGAGKYRRERSAALAVAADPAAGAEPARTAAAAPADRDIAIVGMACVFPDAPDLATYWRNVVGGHDAITEVPADRWDPEIYFDPDAADGTASVSKWGGFLPRIPFDALRFGLPPATLPSVEPVQLLALEVARRALDDAFGGRPFPRERTSVVFGAEAGSDLASATVLRATLPAYYGKVPDAIDPALPRLTADSFPGMLANVIAGRVANRLDLGGSNYIVDAACASSLAAVDIARKELLYGTSDVVLCGGADLHNGIGDFLLFSSVQALSRGGKSRPFDHHADGIALGEGVACLVLRRLADARRDGDRVYAVIKGIGSSSDGKSLGLTAPRKEGQRAALARAYLDAELSPSRVALVEAHGTGTVVGDRTELLALTEEFTEAGAGRGEIILGSVKSQIGHTKCAAGLAGLIKTALAVHAGVRPPTSNMEQPNPAWDAESSPFSFTTSGRPWPTAPGGRYAGVSAFGFGGTNFHVVLGADSLASPPQTGLQSWPAELFVFAGPDPQAARTQVRELADLVTANERAGRPWPMRVLAAAAAERAAASRQPVQISLVARDLAELGELLRHASTEDGEPQRGLYFARDFQALSTPGTRPAVAFLFPGQGSQFTGMFGQLLTAFPRLQRHLAEPWADKIFPPTAFDDVTAVAQTEALIDTRAAQPALGIAALIARDLLAMVGLRPDMAAGHSYGELAALCASGAVADVDLLHLSLARADAIADATRDIPGAMAAIALGEDEVRESLTASGLLGPVVVANVNAPGQTVISGETAAVEQALGVLRAAGHVGRRIPVACAFHSPLVAGAGAAFAESLAGADIGRPGFPVFANRTARPYPDEPREIRRELTEEIAAPVRFADEIEAMYAVGARVFVEAGPGRTLARLSDAVLGDRPHLAVPLQPSGSAGIRDYLDALARIAVSGVPLDLSTLFRGRAVPPRPGEPVPAPARWLIDGQLVRGADGQPLPGGLRPAQRIEEPSVTHAHDNQDSQILATAREQLVADFLRSSREMLAAQRDVLLSYLGPAAPPLPAASPPPAVPLPEAPLPETPPNGHVITAAPAALTAPAAARGPEQDIEGVVRSVISERTGYPPDMIEPDLDLEADLSIDSIKRMEISATLITRLAPGTRPDDAEIEDLSRARTASGIGGWLSAHLAPAAAGTQPRHNGSGAQPAPGADAAAATERASRGERPSRYQWRAAEIAEPGEPEARSGELAGKRVLVLGAGPALAAELGARLAEHGAVVDAADSLPDDWGYAGVIYLPPLGAEQEPVLPEGFALIQSILSAGVDFLVMAVAAPAGRDTQERDRSLLGLRGLFRTAAREFPSVNVKLVETDTLGDPGAAASVLLTELMALDHQPVIFREGGTRRTLTTVRADLGGMAATGAGPADDGAAEARALGLDSESVLLVVGGARGITSRIALTFAAASRCRLILAGRTPQPTEPESADTAAVRTLGDLRAVFVARGNMPIRQSEKEVRRILTQRELSETMADASRYGSEVSYRTIDVLDTEAVRSLVKDVYQQYGRLDGVIYGAGVTVDQLVAKTTMESFRLVYATKVSGAAALLTALADLPVPPRFAVLFGSVATVIGSRGQVGYAAANDALETLAHQWADQTGARGVTVHWGPWAPVGSHAGMVSPELERDFSRRGLALIDPEEGPMCLLRELAWGGTDGDAPATVIYAPSGWLEP
jgi:acyl transferase domain-containing protein